ncbi:MAG: translocation/assembly module TamB domain-containing protein [Methylovulum sp.]|nr:translocation/assembly module TamB domain-containing protein [Methylovulum sp.]
MMKRIMAGVLMLALMLPVGLLGLMASESGSRWLVLQLFSSPSLGVSVAGIQGRLLDRIELNDLRYHGVTETIAIKRLVLAWQARALLLGTLRIADLSVDGVDVTSRSANDPDKSGFDANTGFSLPVQLVIEQLLLTDITLDLDGQVYAIDKLYVSAASEQQQFKINSLTLNSPLAQASLQGQIGLGAGFPVDLQAEWQVHTDNNGLWQGSSAVHGDVRQLAFDSQLAAPFKLVLSGELAQLLETPQIKLKGDWQQLRWPVTGATPQINSGQGHFELAGALENYRLAVDGLLSQQYMPDATLVFDGKGSLTAMVIEKLAINSKTGLFELTGDVSWRDVPEFAISATGQGFNLGLLVPELPGKLSFNTYVQGRLDDKALQLDADIKQLSGQLRGHPVHANGKLELNAGQLKVDDLRIVSGVNQLSADGGLGDKQTPLKLAINMPDLSTLWPNLSGKLQGQGTVQGDWKHPEVQFVADAQRLNIAGHSAKQLAVDIDYHQNPQTASHITLSAYGVKTGALDIANAHAKLQGSLAQHQFNADVASSYGDMSLALSGRVSGETWAGDLARLDMTSKDAGLWRLRPIGENVAIRVERTAAGINAAFDRLCLAREPGSLCAQGRHAANGDIKFDLSTTALPLKLLQAMMPAQLDMNNSVLNGDAHIQRQKTVLAGSYNFTMPPATIFFQRDQQRHDIKLGVSSVSGTLAGDKLSVDVDLDLAAQDMLRGRLLADIGKAQTVSGQISAAIADFAVVEALVPSVSHIKGRLNADLTVQGTLQKPAVVGAIDFVDGAVETADFSLRDIALHGRAQAGNRIQLQGVATPVMVAKPGAVDAMTLNSVIHLDADLQQQNGLPTGHYLLTTPEQSSIQFKSKQTTTKLVFGASSISGQLNGDKLTADLELAMTGQDYCRAKLNLDTGTHSLSGQLTALVTHAALIEHIIPQISDVSGQLLADFSVAGTVQKPLPSGVINLSKASVKLDGLGIDVHDINLQALAGGDNAGRVQLQGSAKSGMGAAKLNGFLLLQAASGWPVELSLTGENFELAKLPEAQILVSPDLHLSYSAAKSQVNGLVKVPKAAIQLKQLPENAVKVSADEVMVGAPPAAENAAVSTGMDMDITVELGKDVSFSGQGLQTNLSGRLKILNDQGAVTMRGNVDMDKASYQSYGQSLAVRKGRFIFNGPVDNPWLDVEAIRVSKSKKVTAILSVSGPLKSPQTRISSEPSLAEADALAYLVTGGPLNQVSRSESNMVASAALSYGAGQVSWVAEQLGIDEFNVQEGTTLKDTLVSVGQYLTPEFYVGTKVGLFNKQAVLVLKRKLTATLNVETQTGTSQRIKLNYERDIE